MTRSNLTIKTTRAEAAQGATPTRRRNPLLLITTYSTGKATPTVPVPPVFPFVTVDPSPAVFRLLWQRFGHLEKGPQQEKARALVGQLQGRYRQFPNAALRHRAALFEFRAFILVRFFLSDRFSDSAAAAAAFGYTPEQGARLAAAWKVIYGVAEEVRAVRYRASELDMEVAAKFDKPNQEPKKVSNNRPGSENETN